mgnify:CR=1 FL=1
MICKYLPFCFELLLKILKCVYFYADMSTWQAQNRQQTVGFEKIALNTESNCSSELFPSALDRCKVWLT